MKTFSHIISDELGIHARPAGMIAKVAKEFDCKIMIGRPDKMVDASRIIGIMGLAMKCGDKIVITADGNEEDKAIKKLEELLKENL